METIQTRNKGGKVFKSERIKMSTLFLENILNVLHVHSSNKMEA